MDKDIKDIYYAITKIGSQFIYKSGDKKILVDFSQKIEEIFQILIQKFKEKEEIELLSDKIKNILKSIHKCIQNEDWVLLFDVLLNDLSVLVKEYSYG